MKKDQHPGPGSESQRPSEAPVQKKTYISPELQEWGSVVDLTQGKKAQLQDSPAKGGSPGI
ncbi:MAG: hypothetical protein QOH06_5313 [Acidobacteriota bacterium]|jgi:hypothetical protein|nr:hypothetical protein [Acidobacteriota bacterium]